MATSFTIKAANPFNPGLRVALTYVAISLVLLVVYHPTYAVAASPKPSVIKSLQDWRGRLIVEDERLSARQKQTVASISLPQISQVGSPVVSGESTPNALETRLNEIEKLDGERVEFEARRRIVDQLIFAIDTKWNGSDLRGFIENLLLDLAITDLSEPGQGGWWRFLIQMAIALRESAEPGADAVKFCEAYMSQSGVLNPKSALDVLQSQDYIGH